MILDKYLSYELRPSFAFRGDDPVIVDQHSRLIIGNPGRLLQLVEQAKADPIKEFILINPHWVSEYAKCLIDDWLEKRITRAKEHLEFKRNMRNITSDNPSAMYSPELIAKS